MTITLGIDVTILQAILDFFTKDRLEKIFLSDLICDILSRKATKKLESKNQH